MVRIAVMYLAGIQALLFTFLCVLSLLDGGSSPAVGDLAQYAAILCVFGIVPALVLAVLNRFLPLALLLSLSVVPFALYGVAQL